MKEIVKFKFESSFTVEAANSKLGAAVGEAVSNVLKEGLPYAKRVAEAYTKELEKEVEEDGK